MKKSAKLWWYSVCIAIVALCSTSLSATNPPGFADWIISTSSSSSINGPNSVCEGDVVTYTYPYVAGNTYNWSVVGGTGIATTNLGNNTTVFTVTWGLAGPGSVSIQEFSGGGLVSSASLNVTINGMPNPQIVSDFDSDCVSDSSIKEGDQHFIRPPSFDCETVCEDSPVNYTTAFVSGNTYQWTVIGSNNGITGATTNSATVTWGSPGQALVVVTETTPAGCVQTDTICIEIVEKPISKFTVDQGSLTTVSAPTSSSANTISICKDGTVCFDDHSVGATSWFWDFGNGNTSQQQSPCETFTTPGTYMVMQIVENDCHCADTTYMRVNVEHEEGPEIVCQNVVCKNGTFIYDAILPAPCSGGHYEWTISGNGTIVNANGAVGTMLPQYVDGTDVTSIEINWASGPVGVISLKLIGCGGICDQITTVNIPIIPNTINIEGDEVVCQGEWGKFNVPCFPGTKYTWKVNGIPQTGNEHEFMYQFFSTGSYNITVDYTNDFLNCSGSSNTFVVKVLNPFEINGPDKVCEGSSATISGPGGSQLNWEVKDQGGTVVASGGISSSYSIPSSLAPGSYTVLAHDVSNPRDYCNDYAIHGIVVIAQPPAPTVINGPIEVCVGEVSVYTASPVSSEYYLEWEVNNGGSTSTSNGNSVSVTWNSGTKSITLYHVSKVSNCPSPGYTVNIIDKTPPPVNITGPNNVCANTPVGSPEIYSTTAVLDGYSWSIVPATAGSVVSGQGTNTASVIWNNYSGFADVRLTPEVCNTPQTPVDYTVNVNTSVMSISTSAVYPLCQNSSTSWTASFSFGSGSGYTWSIEHIATGTVVASGTGNVANHNFPSSSPNNSGSFVLTMSATNCGVTHTVTENITVNPAPVANLTYSGGNNINCIDQNSATLYVSVQGTGPYTYDWLHNGGSLGLPPTTTNHTIGPNAAHAGNYTVVITDGNGCTSSTNVVRARVCGTPVVCSPNGGSVSYTTVIGQTSPVPGCDVVRFFENVVGPTPSSLQWNFAGIGSASGSMPTFTFPASGVYPVTLTATYGPGICNNTYTFDVVVPVISDFEINISCPGNSFDVDLINTTDVVHGPLSLFTHNWTVTDLAGPTVIGTSSSQDYLNVAGLIPGHTYEIRLKETRTYTWNGQTINAACEHTETFTMPFKADADFTMSSNVVCEGNPLALNDNSTGDIISWTWDFGDGSTILADNTEKTYTTPNTYTINLDIVDEYGCTSNYSEVVDVKANNLAGTINVSPVMPMCPGTTANLVFTNTTSPSSAPYTYLWSDGSTAISTTATQTSTHYLAVTDTYGCFQSFGPETVEVVEIPHAVIFGENEYCVGDEINLICNYGSSYDYEWFQFLSGTSGYVNAGVTGTNFNLASAPVGTHYFKVELKEPISGCTKESLVFTVTVHPNPVAPIITTNPSPACPDSPVLLTVTNAAAYSYVTWSSGDVNASTLAGTAGTYFAVGTDVNGCTNYSSTEVHELPDFCSFMCGCYSDCIDQGASFNFPGILGSYTIWRWERLVSGSWTTVSSGSGTVADFTTSTPGNYTLRLYVQTDDGCDGYSCEVDITLVPCKSEPCEGEIKMLDVSCEYSPDLGVGYKFFMDINFAAFGMGCEKFTYTIIPPTGSIPTSSLTPYPYVQPYGDQIGGWWYPGTHFYPGSIVCFDVIITNECDTSFCTMEVCFEVPECGDPKAVKRSINELRNGSQYTPSDESGDIEFYPNPSSGMLKISAPEEGSYQITIYDMSGKLVFTHQMLMNAAQSVEFNLQNLPAGTYNIQCIGNQTIKTERLIILKE
jgi:PKD repeat protein